MNAQQRLAMQIGSLIMENTGLAERIEQLEARIRELTNATAPQDGAADKP